MSQRARVCSRCGRRRPLSAFGSNGAGRLRADCKPCRNAAQRARRRRRAERPAMLRPAPTPRVYSQGGRAIAWIEAHCVHSRGPWRGRALRLLPWQRELLWRLLELRPREGAAPELWPRRYRRALIGLPAGNGKSELLAALALWLLVDDGGPAPEIAVAGASDRDAAVAFGAARTMCELSPGLRALTSRWERAIELPLRPGARLVRVAGGASADVAARYSAVLLDDLERWTLPRQAAGHAALASGPGRGAEPLLVQMAAAGWDRGDALLPRVRLRAGRYASARTTIAASSSSGSMRPRSSIRPRNAPGARRTRPRG